MREPDSSGSDRDGEPRRRLRDRVDRRSLLLSSGVAVVLAFVISSSTSLSFLPALGIVAVVWLLLGLSTLADE